MFCERYKANVQARQFSEVGDALYALIPQRIGRITTPADTACNTVKRKSSEHQLLTTVVQGTPLLAPQLRQSDNFNCMRLPKLPASDIRLQQFLKRKKLVIGLTPRVSRKSTTLNFGSLEQEQLLSSTTKEIQTHPVLDFIQKVNRKVHNLRKPRVTYSQSPELSVGPEISVEVEKTPLETLQTSPKVGVDPGNEVLDRPQTIETQRGALQLPDDLNTSTVLMARRIKFSTQTRSCSNSMPPDPISVPKPVLKRRRRPELKPTPPNLSVLYSTLHSELSQVLLRSNGLTPTVSDSPYKFYVGPGNNSSLVAGIIKKRWFWTRVDSWQQADFIWTQNKQSAIVEKLPTSQTPPSISNSEFSPAIKPSGRKKTLFGLENERKKSGIALISESISPIALNLNPDQIPIRIYNRIERNYQLTSKKRLFLNLQGYFQSKGNDVFSVIPMTFLVQSGREDPEFKRFESEWREKKGLWIVKPGELTNCGRGIHVSMDIDEIRSLVASVSDAKGRKRSHIVQKYIEKPLLVFKRKFDIRCYGLLTCFNGHVQGYFYHDGYLRTSSKEFSLKNTANRFVHLTNDAVQKKSEDYGKFESGNKLSYAEFQKYLEGVYGSQVDFWRDLWPQIKRIVTETFRAAAHQVDPQHRRHTFEVLGYDFMIDEDFRVWLIEVNTNPCLALSSPYLARLIPTMLDNALRIALDPYFPEPAKKRQGEWTTQAFENRFEAVFSSLTDANPGANEALSLASDDSEESEAEEAN